MYKMADYSAMDEIFFVLILVLGEGLVWSASFNQRTIFGQGMAKLTVSPSASCDEVPA